QAHRPYQPWGEIDDTKTSARLFFSQLQLEVIKRLSAGFLLQAEYSYTRSRDNAATTSGAQNPNREMADYGNTDSVPRQALVFNYLYDLPIGPGSWNWDIGLQKIVAITERHRLQIRADFLDVFNHFNLGSPSGTIADTRDGGLPNPNSGKIFGGSGNRIVQLGMKYQF